MRAPSCPFRRAVRASPGSPRLEVAPDAVSLSASHRSLEAMSLRIVAVGSIKGSILEAVAGELRMHVGRRVSALDLN